MNAEVRRVAYSDALFAPLHAEARAEGHRFLDRLRDEWRSGTLRFGGPGEILLGAFDGNELIGVGGISRDPYAPAPGLGRLRHLYVRPAARRRGIGRHLVARLLDQARAHFDVIRLSTGSEAASCFYEGIGFERVEAFKQTHRLKLGASVAPS